MRNIKFFLLVSALALIGAGGYIVLAQEITYPVAELANCQNEQECRTYCDDPDNMGACVAFAERHNLMSEEDAQRAKAFLQAGSQGPGQCKSQQECENYCDDVSRIQECLAFAERTGLMPQEELEEAKKVAQALQSGAQLPGQCRNKNECEAYCEESSHMKECIDFAEKAGFMSEKELKEAKQVLKAFEAGLQTPGNCKGKQQCEAYCSGDLHMEECFTFAVAAGFIPPEEAEQAKKMMSLMAKGGMPGNCRSKEQCEVYCADESHLEECANAFVAAGFISEQEKEIFMKTGGKGPGDCKGKEECESFCNDPANQEICFEFGKEHGLISEQDLANMEEGMKQARQGLESAPPEVASCLQEKVGAEVLEKIRSGQFTPNPQIGEAMKTCFEQNMPQGPPSGMQGGGEGGMPGSPGQFQGPGGCASQEECQAYCQANPDQCGGFAPPQGDIPQEFQGSQQPPAGFQVPEGFQGSPEEIRQQIEQQMQQQYQQQYEQQYQQQYQQQLQQQYPQQIPPSGEIPPPSGEIQPQNVLPPASPPQDGPPPGGSILDAASYFLRSLIH